MIIIIIIIIIIMGLDYCPFLFMYICHAVSVIGHLASGSAS